MSTLVILFFIIISLIFCRVVPSTPAFWVYIFASYQIYGLRIRKPKALDINIKQSSFRLDVLMFLKQISIYLHFSIKYDVAGLPLSSTIVCSIAVFQTTSNTKNAILFRRV